MKTYRIYAGDTLIGQVKGDTLTSNATTIYLYAGDDIVAMVPAVGFAIYREAD